MIHGEEPAIADASTHANLLSCHFAKRIVNSVGQSRRPDRSGLLENPFKPGTLDRHPETAVFESIDELSMIVRRMQLVKLHTDPVDSRHDGVRRGLEDFVLASFTVDFQQAHPVKTRIIEQRCHIAARMNRSDRRQRFATMQQSDKELSPRSRREISTVIDAVELRIFEQFKCRVRMTGSTADGLNVRQVIAAYVLVKCIESGTRLHTQHPAGSDLGSHPQRVKPHVGPDVDDVLSVLPAITWPVVEPLSKDFPAQEVRRNALCGVRSKECQSIGKRN